MRTGEVLVTRDIKESLNGMPVDHAHLPTIIENMLHKCAFIADHPHPDHRVPRNERIHLDQGIRYRYVNRPQEADDSLYCLRQNHYLDPASLIMCTIPATYMMDDTVTSRIDQTLRGSGLNETELQEIKYAKQQLYQDSIVLCEKRIAGMKTEERQNVELCAQIKEHFLAQLAFPYIAEARDRKGSAPVHVTNESGRGTFLALATTVPQNMEPAMSQTFIELCLDYLIDALRRQCHLEEISHDTEIYYDFLVAPNATLYLFINLQIYL